MVESFPYLQTRVYFYFFFANSSMFLFFLGYHLKCFRLTPCITKRNHVWKYHLIFFFCNIIIDLLLFRRRCSTKGAAQLLELNNDLSIHQRHLRYLAIEVFKLIMHLNPQFMWFYFEEKPMPYNWRDGVNSFYRKQNFTFWY